MLDAASVHVGGVGSISGLGGVVAGGVKITMSDRTPAGTLVKNSTNVSEMADALGWATFGLGVVIDGVRYERRAIDGGKYAENSAVGAATFVPVAGPIFAATYWGLDTFYPGGFNQAIVDLNNTGAKPGPVMPWAGY